MTPRVACAQSGNLVGDALRAHPIRTVLLGIALVSLGVWLFTKLRRSDMDDPYADPLGTDYPPIYPVEALAPVPVEEAA